jgi:hypothetical protein
MITINTQTIAQCDRCRRRAARVDADGSNTESPATRLRATIWRARSVHSLLDHCNTPIGMRKCQSTFTELTCTHSHDTQERYHRRRHWRTTVGVGGTWQCVHPTYDTCTNKLPHAKASAFAQLECFIRPCTQIQVEPRDATVGRAHQKIVACAWSRACEMCREWIYSLVGCTQMLLIERQFVCTFFTNTCFARSYTLTCSFVWKSAKLVWKKQKKSITNTNEQPRFSSVKLDTLNIALFLAKWRLQNRCELQK